MLDEIFLIAANDTIWSRLGVFAFASIAGAFLIVTGLQNVKTRIAEESGRRRFVNKAMGASNTYKGSKAVRLGWMRVVCGGCAILFGIIFIFTGPFLQGDAASDNENLSIETDRMAAQRDLIESIQQHNRESRDRTAKDRPKSDSGMLGSKGTISQEFLDSIDDSHPLKDSINELVETLPSEFVKSPASQETQSDLDSQNALPSRSSRSSHKIDHDDYPISIKIPSNAKLVPRDLKIPKGTPLFGCWARSWRNLTVISENEDGSVFVHWDGYSNGFDCNMTRDQLIIEIKTIEKLRAQQSTANSGTEESNSFRIWTDVTGKHTVNAKQIEVKDGKVILETAEGRKITLSIEKLSKKDQAFLLGKDF